MITFQDVPFTLSIIFMVNPMGSPDFRHASMAFMMGWTLGDFLI